jgi:putative ABC transport system permease protein
MRTLAQDLRYAIRGLARNPGFTAVATLTLALGVGANTGVFSLVSAVVFRPMPGLAAPDRLVWVTHRDHGRTTRVPYTDAMDYRDRAGVFASLSVVDQRPVHLSADGVAERLSAEIVSGDYFAVLGKVPAAGRVFSADDDRARRPIAVLSTGYARRRFGSDASAVGRTVTIHGRGYTVVGVAPEAFRGLDFDFPPDLFLPVETYLSETPRAGVLTSRESEAFRVIARLAPGATPSAAKAAVAAIADRNDSLRPADRRGITASVQKLHGWVPPGHLGEFLPLAAIGLATTGLVLLIAAANVANLLLGRAVRRRREMGIRLAIGASRGRIVRQLLTESLVLAVMGAAAGVLLAVWTMELLLSRFDVPPALAPNLDVRVLLFATAAAVVTGLMFGLAPAWSASRPSVLPAIRETSGGAPGSRMQSGIVIVQVALSLVLLATSGLFLRSLGKAASVPVGFDRDAAPDVVTLAFDPETQGYSPERTAAVGEEMLSRARALPGVRSAALAEIVPLSNRGMADNFAPDGRPDDQRIAFYNAISPGYFTALGIPLAAGRDFTPADRAGAPRVAIVNETLARGFWPGRSPLGQGLATVDDPSRGWLVVGVARDVKYLSLTESETPFAYFPLAQETRLEEVVLIARAEPGRRLSASIRSAAAGVDPALPLFRLRTLEESIARSLADRRQGTILVAVFGALALLLAAVGLYGVVAFAVGERRREIGIRMALGATRRQIVSLFFRRGARLVAAGLAAGLLLAFSMTRLLSGMLFGVTPMDVTAIGGVSLLLAGVALAASSLPARRAAHVDPALTLRNE